MSTATYHVTMDDYVPEAGHFYTVVSRPFTTLETARRYLVHVRAADPKETYRVLMTDDKGRSAYIADDLDSPKPVIDAASLHAALIAWRKAERRHAALVLGLLQPYTPSETDDARDFADRALHEVRKLVDTTLSPTPTP